ncbi:MAG: AI-2E family transporter [Spirochaetaceae bacterium]|jgi:predicted PurR-regulated permease PerM|nr:AI-2E family transporter [Spirochaetaceae bacterium]
MNNKSFIQTIFIVALFVLMFALMALMFKPFFYIILWAVLLYILIHPLYKRILARMDKKKRFYEFTRKILAAGFAIGTLLVIIIPLLFVGVLLVQQLLSFLSSAEAFIRNHPNFFADDEPGRFLSELISKITLGNIDLSVINLWNEAIILIRQYSLTIFSLGTVVVKNIGNFTVSMLFIVFSLYFFYVDGAYLLSMFGKAIPINPLYMNTLVRKFSEITRHLFSGYFLVSLYQGVAAFILMKIFSVPGALLFSVVLMFCSFVPIFGAATIWFPVGISLVLTGPVWKGVCFLILAGVCISLLDNFLRPLFLKDRIKIHPLLIFFSILGGVQFFGLNGLLLGPMIIILFFTILDMLTSGVAVVEAEPPDIPETGESL